MERSHDREWTTTDDHVLTLLHGQVKASVIAEKIGRTTRAVHSRAFRIGLTDKGKQNSTTGSATP